MSDARKCPECEQWLTLDSFKPRNLSQFRAAPSSAEVFWESRCDSCDFVYQKRRRFVLTALRRLAHSRGVAIRRRKGTTYRVVEVVTWPCPAEARVVLEAAVEDFNAALPSEKCEVGRHGIQIEAARAVEKQCEFAWDIGSNNAAPDRAGDGALCRARIGARDVE